MHAGEAAGVYPINLRRLPLVGLSKIAGCVGIPGCPPSRVSLFANCLRILETINTNSMLCQDPSGHTYPRCMLHILGVDRRPRDECPKCNRGQPSNSSCIASNVSLENSNGKGNNSTSLKGERGNGSWTPFEKSTSSVSLKATTCGPLAYYS